uniref:NADH:ubiquinone reductase (H(+)-translocating) n=1 Tax=Hydra sinensis TaxID=570418 RepID=R4IXB2_9CNID|nr:NADH dehydrogenase subunit 2 [Hydra sinensis]AGE65901.1 NADH dehydrogenase subunit 2 [Hydra sinensis]
MITYSFLIILTFIILNFYLNKNKNFIFYFLFSLIMFIFIDLSNFQIFLWTLCSFIFINILNNIDLKLDILLLYNFLIFSVYTIFLFENLIILYLCIEIQTFSLFILICSEKKNIKSLEAGLKYFILGSISSSIFLLGTVILFKIFPLLEVNLFNFLIKDFNNFYFLGNIMILSSLIFKIGLSPFHYWIADIYEGSNLNLVSLLASIPKLSLFYIVLKFNAIYEIIFICSILSILIGTIAGFNQTKFKRLIAYSGITNFGFIFLGLSLNNLLGLEVSLFYLFIYLLSNFFFLLILTIYNYKFNYVIELSNYYYYNKILSIVLIVFILSIAGIPPLIGFLNKLFIVETLIFYNLFLTALFCIIITSIGIGFYLRLIKILIFQDYSNFISWSNIIKFEYHDFKYCNIINSVFIFYFLTFYFINPRLFIIIIDFLLNCYRWI